MGDETIDMFKQERRARLGLDRGRELRDEGIRRAVGHAEAVVPKWSDLALAAALQWVKTKEGPFFSYEMRAALEANGLPAPPELRAWGAIPRRMMKAGAIRHAGVFQTDKPEQHMALTNRWVRA